MEDLLVGSIGRTADGAIILRPGQIFDMAEDHISLLTVILVVLPAALSSNVRGNARVDDDVFLPGVVVDTQAANHEEPVPVV